jgi:hypothetical protein
MPYHWTPGKKKKKFRTYSKLMLPITQQCPVKKLQMSPLILVVDITIHRCR